MCLVLNKYNPLSKYKPKHQEGKHRAWTLLHKKMSLLRHTLSLNSTSQPAMTIRGKLWFCVLLKDLLTGGAKIKILYPAISG